MSGFHPEVITGDTRGAPLTSLVWSSLALPCDWKWLSFILSCLDSTALCIWTPASLIIHLSFYNEVALVSCRFTQCCHDCWCAASFENLVFSGSTPRHGMAGSRGTLLNVDWKPWMHWFTFPPRLGGFLSPHTPPAFIVKFLRWPCWPAWSDTSLNLWFVFL